MTSLRRKVVSSLAVVAGIALSPLAAETLEERVARLEKNQAMSTSNFPDWLSFKGELELEYTDGEQEDAVYYAGTGDTAQNTHGRYQLDKFVFGITVKLSEHLKWYTELDAQTGSDNVEKFWATFSGLPGNAWLSVGLHDRFTKANGKFDMANRTTENYPLAGSALWRDQSFGIILGAKHAVGAGPLKDVFWRATLGDGLEINERQPGEIDNFELTHDNDQAADVRPEGNKTEWGMGAGFTFQPLDNYIFDVAGWYIISELNNDEKERLKNITGYRLHWYTPAALTGGPPSAVAYFGDTQWRSGFRTTHKFDKNTIVTYELWEAVDDRLRRNGYYIQGGHKIKFDQPLIADEFFKSITPFVRWEEYNVNIPLAFADSETWDRNQWVYAALIELTSNKNLKSTIKVEYTYNDEQTGADRNNPLQRENPHNNEWLIQLELKF